MNFLKNLFKNKSSNSPEIGTRGLYTDGSSSTDQNSSQAIGATVSTENSSTSTLNNGATFTGTGVDVISYASVVVAVKTDKSGLLYIEFSPDNSNWDSSLSYSVAAATNEIHRLSVTRRYFRVRFTNNSGENQTYFRLQSILGTQTALTSNLNSTIQSDADSLLSRSLLIGQTDGGAFANVPVTAEGHLEVALHAPRLPFGSIHTENLTPVFQTDAVYGLNAGQVIYSSSLSGGVTTSDSSFSISTGTTIYAQAQLQSRRRLRYRPGQGVVGRFTALFTSGIANSYQVAGFGHAEDGIYFGYKNASFGILYSKRGVREVQTLTITTASNTNESVTVTLGGVAHSIAVTNSNNIQRTVWELSRGTYTGWKAEPRGATVVFVADAVGNKTGTFSVAGTTIVGTFAETQAGAATTEEFISKSDWNGDKLDGTGASGVTLDPTKGNVYQIGIQYLGFGAIEFKIEVTSADSNNADFVTVHTMKLPNTLTSSSFGNPSFPFTMAVYSAGSTTNLTLKVASFAGFIEGQKKLHGNRFSYFNSITTAGSSNFQELFTVMNTRYYGGRSNQSVVNLLSISGAIKHTQPVTFYLIKDGSLVGNPNFSSYATNSCTYVDTAATSVTYATNDKLIWSGQLGETGDFTFHFSDEITLQPGEWVTLAARASTGTAAYTLGSLNTREDQ